MLQIPMVTRQAQSVIMPIAVSMGYMSSLAAPMLLKNTKKKTERERETGSRRLLHSMSFFCGLGDCPDVAPSLSGCQWAYRGWKRWNDSDINAVGDHASRIQAEPFLIQLRGKGELSQRKGGAINTAIHQAWAQWRHQDQLGKELESRGSKGRKRHKTPEAHGKKKRKNLT